MGNLTLGSLFDGSGGFPLGGLIAGITPVWASEIEPFPIRVTTKRMPFMKHYGDVSGMDGGKVEPVDIITFGSPCQDMSVAGKRSGLDGSRSSLFYEAVRIIKEMRCATDGRYPRYAVWENVPGAFSSNGGEDFRAVLETLCSVRFEDVSVPRPERWPNAGEIVADGFSLAWRVLDAQYWGVPQRRKRIYLVADFAGGSAGKILFESEGLSGYSAESFRAWQRTAGSTADGAGNAGICLNDQGGQRMDVTEDVTDALRAEAHYPPCVMALENHPADSRITVSEDDKVQTLTSRMGTGGGNVPLVMDTPKTLKIRSGCEGGGKGALVQEDKSATLSCNNDQTVFVPQAYGIGAYNSEGMKSDNPHAGIYEADTSRTLDCSGGTPSANQGGIAVVEQMPFELHTYADPPGSESEVSPTLDTTGAKPTHRQCGEAIVESYAIQGNMIGRDDKNGPQGCGVNEDVSFTLNATDRHAVYALTTGSFLQTAEDQSPTLLARDYKDPTAVAYGIGRDAFNQGQNAKYKPAIEEELQPTLVAKGPGAVQSGYTVRRLTPTECARLQGFPDWWCDDLETEKPTDEELYFWYKVFEDYRRVTNPDAKPKSSKQILKWLKNPHSDSAEYKMWGNGVALPCVVFVLSGIVYCSQLPAE